MAYAVPSSSQGYVSLFSKSAPENLPTGSTQLGFDTNYPLNSPMITNNYTASGDNSTFVVNTSGIYSIEGNISVAANGATWAVLQKTLAVSITRGSTTITAGAVTANQTSTNNYSFHVGFSFPLLVGDQIKFIHTGTVTSGGPPTALGLQNGFDLNTWCVFTFVRSI